jgi:hypothetical protein
MSERIDEIYHYSFTEEQLEEEAMYNQQLEQYEQHPL